MCNCTQCKYTDSFAQRSFAEWPKGASATPREAKALYQQHAAFNWKDARKREGVGATGAAFYGVPAGSTRAEVERVLNESFRENAP